MQALISPALINGIITAPASKSAMQRACAAALIKGGTTILHNPGISADDKAALNIIRQLGATITEKGDSINIHSNGIRPFSDSINCGESGLSVRMFTSIAALSAEAIEITGSGSLLKRPLDFFTEVLPQLGVACSSNNGLLPLRIQGPLVPKNIEVDGSLSSQFLTGLLMAYAGAGAENVSIAVRQLNSKPYIDLTLQVMKDFGLRLPLHDAAYTNFQFRNKGLDGETGKPLHYTVEADWSGAAFLLVAGAIAGDVVVNGLDVFSMQADKAILQALMQTGALLSIEEGQVHVRKSSMKAFHFNATDCPDLFPPLVALAGYCKGTSVIEGVHRLQYKESNRAITLQDEFAKMGINIKLQDNLMLVEGGDIKAGAVSSHHDHRIAMACAVAALAANDVMKIDGAEAVEKSYPQFWQHLQQLNVPVSLRNN